MQQEAVYKNGNYLDVFLIGLVSKNYKKYRKIEKTSLALRLF